MESSGEPGTTDKRMRLRYAGVCRLCGTDLPARTDAIYEKATKTVRCVECSPPDSASGDSAPTAITASDVTAAEPGSSASAASQGGSSARREYERRKAKDEDRLRQKWGRLGGVAVALSDERQSTKAFDIGAVGEERLAARLNASVSDSLAVLHDRLIPGSDVQIDHIAVTPGGIWVIDAKRYTGRPRLEVRARGDKLIVGRRNRTNLVHGMLKQIDVVRDVAGDVPVTGALCFVNGDWPLIGGSFSTRGVHVLWPRLLTKMLCEEGPALLDIAETKATLASRLLPA